MEERLDIREYNGLDHALAMAQHTVYKRYLQELEMYPLVKPTDILLDETTDRCTRFLQLQELSCKEGEDIFQKLSTVYHASMSLGCNLIVMIDVERIDAPAKIYIGVRGSGVDDDDTNARIRVSYQTLKNGIISNFPGTKLRDVPAQKEMPELVDSIFGDATKYISSVSCVAAARDKASTEHKTFVQGLERLIDAMKGNTYTAIFIAEPITEDEQAVIRNGYESLYSTLSSFRKSSWSFNENESDSVMESLSKGISEAVTDGTSQTLSHTVNAGINMGIQTSRTESDSNAHSKGSAKSGQSMPVTVGKSVAGALQAAGAGLDTLAIITGNPAALAAGALAGIVGSAVGKSLEGRTESETVTDTVTSTVGNTRGENKSWSEGTADTTSDAENHSTTHTMTESETKGKTLTKGIGRTLQIENTNKSIEEMLKRIEEQLERTQEGEDYGAYSCGAYFLSGKQESCLLAANTYRALMIGKGSAVESGAINTWNGLEDKDRLCAMKEYLRRFVHPVFALSVADTATRADGFILYTPGTIVSGMELPLHLGFPTKSVYGLPVIEHAEFGRNVENKECVLDVDTREIALGKIYYMGQIEKKSKVELALHSLTAHTFITGSTGAGKSNAIYTLLERVMDQTNVHFMVIEPAKGEYKDKFGHLDHVQVYGTNAVKTELLRINPFSFPDEIHVLEHIDRLTEIFNACWPMYAAMPAVLKDAIERSYINAGWDLIRSECKYEKKYGQVIYPSFIDVLKMINVVMEESQYSSDSKGDYTGALSTRIKSLTNGIYGQIFTNDELTNQELYDENVIVDLSRVGSIETKALLMGLLVMKMQEYRMTSQDENNKELKHLTVLEEAHNLLKKTSSEQSTDSSNLVGKSVEMLANSIAEMRTYGEGFVIADQSPGLLDMSVIRNTNTKIILRLPDISDRELVGRAASLSDEQILELSKLETGVAAVYQNDWVEPVLCKINSCRDDEKKYNYVPSPDCNINQEQLKWEIIDYLLLTVPKKLEVSTDVIAKLEKYVYRLQLPVDVKVDLFNYYTENDPERVHAMRSRIIYNMFNSKTALTLSGTEQHDINSWYNMMLDKLEPSLDNFEAAERDKIIGLITYENAARENTEEAERLKGSFFNFARERESKR